MMRMIMRKAIIISCKEGFESVSHALPRNATATHGHDPFPMGKTTVASEF